VRKELSGIWAPKKIVFVMTAEAQGNQAWQAGIGDIKLAGH